MKYTKLLFVTVMLAVMLVLGGGVLATSQASPQGTLVIATTQDPGSWDPIDTFYLAWGMVGSNIYDGLVDRGVDLKVGPGLATSWEWVGEGNKRLRFHLRHGVKFHDGEPFNAEAVKFTFDRLLGPEGAKGPQRSNYTSIGQVEIVDNYTVDFIMKNPDPVLITKLSGYGAMIVPPKYIQEKGDVYFDTHPVGTGPFEFVSYTRDDQLVLKANPNYWGGTPKVAKVIYRFIPESSTRLAELEAGRVDIMQGVQISQASVVKSKPNLQLLPVGSPTVVELRFDVSKPPADNVAFRQALNYAVDKQTIIDTILEGFGHPVASFQSDMSRGYSADLKSYPYDPKKAKQLLVKAGVKPGTEIGLDFIGTDATFREVAEAVSSYLGAVGLNVKLHTYEENTYFSDIIPQAKTDQLFYMDWGGWTLDFDNTAALLYGTGQYWNPTFSDPKVDNLIKQERSTYDQEKRAKILQDLAAYLHDIAIGIPLYQEVNLWAINKRVHGFIAPPDDRIRLLPVSVK